MDSTYPSNLLIVAASIFVVVFLIKAALEKINAEWAAKIKPWLQHISAVLGVVCGLLLFESGDHLSNAMFGLLAGFSSTGAYENFKKRFGL